MEEVRRFAASQIKCASTLNEIPSVLSSMFTTVSIKMISIDLFALIFMQFIFLRLKMLYQFHRIGN